MDSISHRTEFKKEYRGKPGKLQVPESAAVDSLLFFTGPYTLHNRPIWLLENKPSVQDWSTAAILPPRRDALPSRSVYQVLQLNLEQRSSHALSFSASKIT